MTKRKRKRQPLPPRERSEYLLSKDDGSPYTAEEIGDMMVQAATEAGLHPAQVHAIKVTGFIVTTQNAHLFDEEDQRSWDAAVAEGEELHGAVPD